MVFGYLAVNSGVARMLDWLKRKASPAPSEHSLGSKERIPLTDVRLERMLDRLGSDRSERREPVAETLNKIEAPPSTDSVAGSEPVAGALNEIDSLPSADSIMAGERAARALNEVDPPPIADSRSDDRFTLRRGDFTITHRGHGPSAAELLAKGYSFAAGPDGKMLILDAGGRLVDTALAPPSTDGMAAGEPAAEAVNEIEPLPAADGKAASGPGQMYVIAVASQKGDSGKTTIAAHLAVEAGRVDH